MLLELIFNTIRQDETNWNKFKDLFEKVEIAPKTTLLNEGEIARYMYFIKKGCLRLCFNNEGKDTTFQFFFENQAVSSFESFFSYKPSIFRLESIEPSHLIRLKKDDFDMLVGQYPELKDALQKILIQRMAHFAKLFLSHIKNNPQKRYQELMKDNPEILLRVPQHYIASYLGITPVSLSRIRNKG